MWLSWDVIQGTASCHTTQHHGCHCSLYINIKMEEVQLKALELLSQMSHNSQIPVLSQHPCGWHASIFFYGSFPELSSSWGKTSGRFTHNQSSGKIYCFVWDFYSCSQIVKIKGIAHVISFQEDFFSLYLYDMQLHWRCDCNWLMLSLSCPICANSS